MFPDRDAVRQRAHELWEREGRPVDRDNALWLEAERQLRQDASANSTTNSTMDIERERLEFDREKYRGEMRYRRRELSLKTAEQRRSAWTNPLFLAIVAGAVGLFSNSLVALINGTM